MNLMMGGKGNTVPPIKDSSFFTYFSVESVSILKNKEQKLKMRFHYKFSFNHYSED